MGLAGLFLAAAAIRGRDDGPADRRLRQPLPGPVFQTEDGSGGVLAEVGKDAVAETAQMLTTTQTLYRSLAELTAGGEDAVLVKVKTKSGAALAEQLYGLDGSKLSAPVGRPHVVTVTVPDGAQQPTIQVQPHGAGFKFTMQTRVPVTASAPTKSVATQTAQTAPSSDEDCGRCMESIASLDAASLERLQAALAGQGAVPSTTLAHAGGSTMGVLETSPPLGGTQPCGGEDSPACHAAVQAATSPSCQVLLHDENCVPRVRGDVSQRLQSGHNELLHAPSGASGLFDPESHINGMPQHTAVGAEEKYRERERGAGRPVQPPRGGYIPQTILGVGPSAPMASSARPRRTPSAPPQQLEACQQRLPRPTNPTVQAINEAIGPLKGFLSLGFTHYVEVIPHSVGCKQCKGSYVVGYKDVSRAAMEQAATDMLNLLDNDGNGEWDDNNIVCQLSFFGSTLIMFKNTEDLESNTPEFEAVRKGLNNPELVDVPVQMLGQNETTGPSMEPSLLFADVLAQNKSRVMQDPGLMPGAPMKKQLAAIAKYATRAVAAGADQRKLRMSPKGYMKAYAMLEQPTSLIQNEDGTTTATCFKLPTSECGHDTEEVTHLVYEAHAEMYPDLFGFHPRSAMYKAVVETLGDCGMPSPRGWPKSQFQPFRYPNCHGRYHYTDTTCGMHCLMQEAVNHVVSSYNGIYSADGCRRVIGEWDPCDKDLSKSRQLLQEQAPLAFGLIRDETSFLKTRWLNRSHVTPAQAAPSPGAAQAAVLLELEAPGQRPVLDFADFDIRLPRKRARKEVAVDTGLAAETGFAAETASARDEVDALPKSTTRVALE